MYQQISLTDLLPLGQPGPLPAELNGLAQDSLNDLSAALDPVPEAYAGTAFVPVVEVYTPYDPDTEVLTDGLDLGAPDPETMTVPAKRRKRSLTPSEIAERHPPLKLGKVEFIELVQLAGGMTDEMLVNAQKHPALAAFWIKFQMASQVERDFPTTGASLDALTALGFLPDGKAPVLAMWPTM